MGTAIEYREYAENQRQLADQAELPQVKASHERAAERWIYLAERIEHCECGLVVPRGRTQEYLH